MKIALDPYMIRHLTLAELPAAVAELGYDQIELSPRSDFLDWWVMPRATKPRMSEFKAAMRSAGVGLASVAAILLNLILPQHSEEGAMESAKD